ncbi:PEST proteolytic signal-containing nuclear protein-like isoform X2 [Anopheles nili]|uniref:PEST proteolytic signal-containing nuclear protein-like isoform X2 n=1 Tax=Anopheles nili TaxID=185578 RepID=UPI00237A28A4|nr:PEST proteolytic signal-containing nuclear protein-like isoform X2 [Anopheles nili]
MSRWDRRNDEGQYHQRNRLNEARHSTNRTRLSRSRSRSESPERSRSHSRSPTSERQRRPPVSHGHHPGRYDHQQHQRHQQDQQQDEERRRRQEALDSRGRAGPNGTGTGPGTSGVVGRRTGGSTGGAKPPVTGIQMKLAAPASKEPPRLMKPVANAFRLADDSDDSEPEEMPAECRMRMRNIGRETPTSSGPNSFGKTKHGFCDSKKMFEKKIGGSVGDR